MNAFSLKRFLAVLRKEWIQIKRDPMTLRLIIALPMMQLFLFGYAINSDPKHLPTGLISTEHSKYERSLVSARSSIRAITSIRPLALEDRGRRPWRRAR